ncbi:DUF1810 domain-containing protein [Kaistella palustris]|uniref:DUF1810 domain-containing protein n=1 Tax=Kaistella palustris TaxID=493376 RepID=UPI00040F42AC|nr:DUF1810 domain-containing protein [Kaistella palustris]
MKSNLHRFHLAQEKTIGHARTEMRKGKKTSHWMWYIFPQIKGLGRSETARKFDIQNRQEALEYLQDQILGGRLLELTHTLVEDISGKSAEEIFGYPDWLKFHSCMTLFNLTVLDQPQTFDDVKFTVFKKALDKYYNGESDPATVDIWEAIS